MNATHVTILFDSENQTRIFLYYISCKEKINVGKNFKIMRKSLFNCPLYSHPEIGNFRV
jgi:hypothetical protein